MVRDSGAGGAAEQVIFRDERTTQFLFPGFELKLRRDEAEGYYLNITSPQPKVFVLWRKDEGRDRAPAHAHGQLSTRARAGWTEAPPWTASRCRSISWPWIGEFVERNYRPEPKKKGRWASNKDKGVGFRG